MLARRHALKFTRFKIQVQEKSGLYLVFYPGKSCNRRTVPADRTVLQDQYYRLVPISMPVICVEDCSSSRLDSGKRGAT